MIHRISSGQELKSIYATRTTRGYQKQRISPKIQVKSSKIVGFGSSGLPKASSSLEEVDILLTLVYFLF